MAAQRDTLASSAWETFISLAGATFWSHNPHKLYSRTSLRDRAASLSVWPPHLGTQSGAPRPASGHTAPSQLLQQAVSLKQRQPPVPAAATSTSRPAATADWLQQAAAQHIPAKTSAPCDWQSSSGRRKARQRAAAERQRPPLPPSAASHPCSSNCASGSSLARHHHQQQQRCAAAAAGGHGRWCSAARLPCSSSNRCVAALLTGPILLFLFTAALLTRRGWLRFWLATLPSPLINFACRPLAAAAAAAAWRSLQRAPAGAAAQGRRQRGTC